MKNQPFHGLQKIATAFILIIMLSIHSRAQNNPVKPADETFTIENYYKVKWGYAEEFIKLYKATHYPLLKKALEKGDLISIVAENQGTTTARKSAGTSG